MKCTGHRIHFTVLSNYRPVVTVYQYPPLMVPTRVDPDKKQLNKQSYPSRLAAPSKPRFKYDT